MLKATPGRSTARTKTPKSRSSRLGTRLPSRVRGLPTCRTLLEKRLGRSVHVVNFGRDGYGILQMFDLAVAKVREWKPDLFVIAFISDDLTRDRFWRTKTILDGSERIMVSLRPEPEPDWTTGADLYVMNSKATQEWCHSLHKSQAEGDPVVAELEETVRQGSRVSRRLANVFSVTQSYVFDHLWHGDPFHTSMERILPARNPRHRMGRFHEDERTVRNVKALNDTGIPYMLVHLANYNELKAGKEYRGRRSRLKRRMALINSLEELTGTIVHQTTDHVDLARKETEIPGERSAQGYPSESKGRKVLREHDCQRPRSGAVTSTG